MDQAGAQAGSSHVPSSVVTADIAAEAAVWVTRLHGPNRSSVMERELRDWQARSDAHRLAFERCTETWQDVRRVTVASVYANETARSPTPRREGLPRRALGLAAAGLALGVGMLAERYWWGANGFGTKIGEQRLVMLDDGTRMSLNTDTRVRVDMGSTRRMVSVRHGEALFEVAKDAGRPFVVQAAGTEVVAVGTVFSVRFESTSRPAGGSLSITLIEGQVAIRALPAAAAGVAPVRPLLMQPGQRARLRAHSGFAAPAMPQLDRPNIEQVVAWRRNEVVFDDTSLNEAVSEMNRYSRTHIVLLDDAARSGKRVSGVYRTGDNTGFARAVATLHGLALSERDGRLELAIAQ